MMIKKTILFALLVNSSMAFSVQEVNNKNDLIKLQNNLVSANNLGAIEQIIVKRKNNIIERGEYLVSFACSEEGVTNGNANKKLRSNATNILTSFLETKADMISLYKLKDDGNSVNEVFSSNLNDRINQKLNLTLLPQLNKTITTPLCKFVALRILDGSEFKLKSAVNNKQVKQQNSNELDDIFGYRSNNIYEYVVPSIITTAIGTANINSPAPRQMALKNAQKNALQQTLGTTISSNTLSSIVDSGESLQDVYSEYTKEELSGTIEDYVILSEGGKDGVYSVRIEATIDPSTVLNSLEKALGMLGNPNLYINTKSEELKATLASRFTDYGFSVVDNATDASLEVEALVEVKQVKMKRQWFESEIRLILRETGNNSPISILENTSNYLPYQYQDSQVKILKAFILNFHNSKNLIRFLKKGVVKIHNFGGVVNTVLVDPRLDVNTNTLIEVIRSHPSIVLISSNISKKAIVIKARMMGGEIEIGHVLMPLIRSHSLALEKDIGYKKIASNQYQYQYKGQEIKRKNGGKTNNSNDKPNYFIGLLMSLWNWILDFFK